MGEPSVDPRSVEVADVWKSDRRAASITRAGGDLLFAYDQSYVAEGGEAVATTLPADETTVVTSGGALPPFFTGLLPEGRRLTALRRRVKTSADDDFSLLLAVGADLIGDVRVLPAGQEPVEVEPLVSLRDPLDLDFKAIAESAGLLDRTGIAGVQDKVSAAMMTLPAHVHGRAAILKLTPPEFPNLVENEAYFLRLARLAGFTVPRFDVVHDNHGDRGLFIERFDRARSGRALRRFAVEDATQVLGRYPADKYQPSSEDVTRALMGLSQAPKVAALTLFRMFVFAHLTGNGDLHAKNMSVLRKAGEWVVSPVYDIPSSLPYPVNADMALILSGREHDLSRKAFLEFADAIALPRVAAQRAIDELLRVTEPLADDWRKAEHEFMRPRNVQAARELRNRRRLLMEGSS